MGQKPRAKALPTYLFFAERKQIALQSAKRNEYHDINFQRGDFVIMTKGRKRNRKKSFWVSDSEWNAIEKIAAETGMGIGEYLRISALGKTIYQIEELKPVLHELKGIGRNLNQLTMLAHQGVIRTVNLTATADGIGRCYAAINRLYADTDAVISEGG